jgi:predicted DNA-binding transcriptional regulator YafY
MSFAKAEQLLALATMVSARKAGSLIHPSQMDEVQEDGFLIVRFEASGLLKMAWHLSNWGDKVEVLEPFELRDMIAGH